MKNYSLEELFCEWQKATPEDRAEAMALLRGEGNAVENCSQLDKLYRIKDDAKKLGSHAITVQRYMDSGVIGRSIVVHVNDIHSAGEVNEKRH